MTLRSSDKYSGHILTDLLHYTFEYSFSKTNLFIEFNILSINSVSILMTVYLDWITLLFISFVLFISSIVIIYRGEYIRGDKTLNRFILLVVIFVLSIILLIISPNLISILLG